MQNGHFRLAKGALWQGGWTKLLTSLQKKGTACQLLFGKKKYFCRKQADEYEESTSFINHSLIGCTVGSPA